MTTLSDRCPGSAMTATEQRSTGRAVRPDTNGRWWSLWSQCTPLASESAVAAKGYALASSLPRAGPVSRAPNRIGCSTQHVARQRQIGQILQHLRLEPFRCHVQIRIAVSGGCFLTRPLRPQVAPNGSLHSHSRGNQDFGSPCLGPSVA